MDKVQEKKIVPIPSTVVCFMCYSSLEYNNSQFLVQCMYEAKPSSVLPQVTRHCGFYLFVHSSNKLVRRWNWVTRSPMHQCNFSV